ncbi:MAG: DegV family protein [Oscillospiraceae bacterium]|nr:DegV family protein [Oscillospiraceae bacterium]MBR2503613.1 DegV family protein [Oscillospiraceae bacterium]
MTWNIVLDSSCDLMPQQAFKNANLKIAPLTIRVGEKEFVDDETIDVPQLLDAMNKEKSASSTACPPPNAFYEHFITADNVICICITSNLSGTYNAAVQAAEMVKEEYPEKNIHVINSYNTAGGMVLMARLADQLIGEGLPFDEISKKLDEYVKEVRLVFTLEKFDNLIKAGRMKPLVGKVVAALGIHLIAQASDIGTVELMFKVRGEEKTLEKMVEYMNEQKDMTGKPVVISHCNNHKAVERIKELIKEKCHTEDITVNHCKGLTSFYAMEKGLLIGY